MAFGAAPRIVARSTREYVDNLKFGRKVRSPFVQQPPAENITLRSISEDHCHLCGIAGSAEDGMKSLYHGCDPSATNDHGNRLFAERILNLHIDGNVLELECAANGHVLHVLGHFSTFVDLDHQLEFPD